MRKWKQPQNVHQRKEALEGLANGETLVDVARTFGVDPTTIGRLQSPFVLGSAAARRAENEERGA
jgi:hypothetical protein